jgi:hypothetical protein
MRIVSGCIFRRWVKPEVQPFWGIVGESRPLRAPPLWRAADVNQPVAPLLRPRCDVDYTSQGAWQLDRHVTLTSERVSSTSVVVSFNSRYFC